MPNFASSIKMKAALPVDDNFNMTFEKMRNINPNTYPPDYFTMCVEDHKFYTYSETNTVDPITGKFRLVNGTGSLTVDSELSTTSENPVQNKVITTTLNSKIDASEKGVADGIAELDENGRLKSSQLPGGIDEIVNGYLYNGSFYEDSAHTQVVTPGESKIYIDLDTNKQYRWSGLAYVEISASLALGSTSSTAGRGDHTEAAYDHSLIITGNPHNVTKSEVGLGNCDNTADLDKPISTATQTALALKENVFRYTTMPTASGDYVAPIQYIGVTTQDYKQGSFYVAVNNSGWEWVEVVGGGSGDSIEYVNELPTSGIQNKTYGIKATSGITKTVQIIKPMAGQLSKEQATAYFSQFFTVTEESSTRLSLSVYPDLVLSRDGWTQDYKAADGDIVTLTYRVDSQEILWTNSSSQETSTAAWSLSPIRCTSANFPSWKYYNGNEYEQSLNELGSGGDIDPKYKKIFNGTLEAWNALTTEEKKEYDNVSTPNPTSGSALVDAVENGNMNAVTSNAVFNAIHGLLSRDTTQGVNDLNNAVTPGTYIISPSISNAPFTGMYGSVLVFGHKTDKPSSTSQWIWQLAVSTDNNYNGAVWIRHSVNSNSLTPTNWSTWEQIGQGYFNGLTTVGTAFDTTYQDGSGSKGYDIIESGLYKFHVYLENSSLKTVNQCQISLYNSGTLVGVLYDYNYSGQNSLTVEGYMRIKSGQNITVTHVGAGGGVGGRCYFTLHKVNEIY